MKVCCPACEGTGRIVLETGLPTRLSPNQAKIYRTIKARPYVFGANDLAGLLYADDPNGGPGNPLATIHTTIAHINTRLSVVGERICANHRGPGATYQVVKLNVV